MTQYIDKDDLVAEIERQQRRCDILHQSNDVESRKTAAIQNGVYCSLLSFVNTLEAKEADAWHLREKENRNVEVLAAAIPESGECNDERIRKELIEMVRLSCTNGDDIDKKIAWLEKRKESGPVEQKSVWSDEDEFRIKLLESLCEDKLSESASNSTMYDEMKITINWLKSLKDRMQPHPKQEWSDEDEVMLGNALWACKEKYCSTETYNWLKSIKDRMALTNKNDFDRGYDVGISAAKFNQWKPTEEQLEALEWSLGDYRNVIFEERHDTLTSLYKDLKKL